MSHHTSSDLNHVSETLDSTSIEITGTNTHSAPLNHCSSADILNPDIQPIIYSGENYDGNTTSVNNSLSSERILGVMHHAGEDVNENMNSNSNKDSSDDNAAIGMMSQHVPLLASSDSTTTTATTTTTTTSSTTTESSSHGEIITITTTPATPPTDLVVSENTHKKMIPKTTLHSNSVQNDTDLLEEKDAFDCLTPEALVRAASSSASTAKMTNTRTSAAESSRLNHEDHTQAMMLPPVHNAIDKEGFPDNNEDEEEDTDKLLASVPPELIRTTGNPASNSSSQPGAYHHYNSIGMAPASNTTTSQDDEDEEQQERRGRNRNHPPPEGESENFLIEATLVTDDTHHPESSSSSSSSSSSPRLPTPPVETASSPMVVVAPPPLYSAQIVDEESQVQNQRLEPFSISNTIFDTGANENVVISKTKLRCIIYVVILLVGISILAITLPLVLFNRHEKEERKRKKRITPDEWDGMLVQRKQQLLLQNYDSYQSITHHMSVITIHNNKIYGNPAMLNSTKRNNKVCSPLYDNHITNEYTSPPESDDKSKDELEDFGDKFFDGYFDYDGIVVTLTCGGGSSSTDSDAATPLILLHNKELLSSTYSDTLNTAQWSNDMNKDAHIEIPMCHNELFPPSDHNDDEFGDEGKNDNKPKRPEDVFENIDLRIYGSYQCRIFPISPYNDRIEQFIFVYSCASGASSSSSTIDSTDVVNVALTAETGEIPIVTSTHIRNLVTNCYSADQDATIDQSPPMTTSVSLSMQRLCRGTSNNDNGDIVVPLRQQHQTSSNDTAISSLYLCQTCDGNILNTVRHNTSAGTNSSQFYEYCSTTSDVKPFQAGVSELLDTVKDTWCGSKEDYDTDDTTLMQYCADIRSSTNYHFYEYLVPNMTVIDNLRLPNNSGDDSSTTGAVCSFDSFLSSFFALLPPEVGTIVASSNEEDAVVRPVLSIFGNNDALTGSSSSNGESTGSTVPVDGTLVAMNLRDILLDVLTQQQQQLQPLEAAENRK